VEHLIGWGLDHATDLERTRKVRRLVEAALDSIKQPLIVAIVVFLEKPLRPSTLMALEASLVALVRQLGRQLLQSVLNACEPEEPLKLPQDLWFECGGYRRRNQKTANRHVASRFGDIVLWRRGFRSWQAGDGSIFPLEMLLGLNQSATPALVDWIGRHMAAAGSKQAAVIELLRSDCGVTMGVKRLRQCVRRLSESMSEVRQEHQVDALLAALAKAAKSSGSRKPVLSVGRDGITLRQHRNSFFEVATAATISVYDRSGKRLTTMYLAWPPELGQATMDHMLTDLIRELLERWQGPLPRLAYVTDSGSNEISYYEKVLRRMVHPRSGKRLQWTRVADYFHASERIWAMAEALFGKGSREAGGWATRMLKSLKKPSGASRVLHSAASHFHRRELSKTKTEEFWRAYRYLQSRTRHMRYSEYASNHIPLGSGVTEAACKTIFTQRLKNSGMRWSHEGAKTILTLRTILLSKTWSPTYTACLKNSYPADLRPYEKYAGRKAKTAA
jgi:hypothetical protein